MRHKNVAGECWIEIDAGITFTFGSTNKNVDNLKRSIFIAMVNFINQYLITFFYFFLIIQFKKKQHFWIWIKNNFLSFSTLKICFSNKIVKLVQSNFVESVENGKAEQKIKVWDMFYRNIRNSITIRKVRVVQRALDGWRWKSLFVNKNLRMSKACEIARHNTLCWWCVFLLDDSVWCFYFIMK